MTRTATCIAFEGDRRLAEGDAVAVALAIRQRMEAARHAPILAFNAETGALLDFDLRGGDEEIRARLSGSQPAIASTSASPSPRRPGRPKLGVVAREVTLLPRHWEWLNAQPGGASVALRRLVDAARRTTGRQDGLRPRQEAAFRFMTTIAGNKPHYEEAIRALFAADADRFIELTAGWPPDVRDHARKLASLAFEYA